jgi:putative ABC transport system permease protein
MMDALRQDLRYAFRQFALNPGYTTVAVVTLTLGIGANTIIFSVVNSVLYRPLPFEQPERLVQIWETNPAVVAERDLGYSRFGVNALNYDEYRAHSSTISEMGYLTPYADNGKIQISGGLGDSEQVYAWGVSSSLFSALGVQPMMGRVFLDEERAPPGVYRWTEVAILSHSIWQRRFGADPDIVGKHITLDAAPATVVGVMPPGFDIPPIAYRGTTVQRHADVYLPLFYQAYQQPRRFRQFGVIGRLAPGVSLEVAREEMTRLARGLEEVYPEAMAGWTAMMAPLHALLTENFGSELYLLMGAVGLVLLVACGNLANLMIVRSTARTTEIAVRTAIGSGRFRVIRLVLTEAIVLSLLGGTAGLLLTAWGTDLLVSLVPANVPRVSESGIDGRVLLFALGISLLTSVLFGLLPALRASTVNLIGSLKIGKTRHSGRRGPWLGSRLLIVSQVAVAMMLLIGAGLLMKSFLRLQSADPGFESGNILVTEVTFGAHDELETDYGPSTPEERTQLARRQFRFTYEALQEIGRLPGVDIVASGWPAPMSGSEGFFPLKLEERPDEEHWALATYVSPDYFRTMQIPLVRGQQLPAWDGVNDSERYHWAGGCIGSEQYCVVIVSETLARTLWPGEDPIGKRIGIYDCCMRVIGVAADASYRGVDDPPLARNFDTKFHLYLPFSSNVFLSRTTTEPAAFAGPIRSALSNLAPGGVVKSTTLEDVLADSLARPRFYMLLVGLFAFAAVALALVGLYGVIAYAVVQRTHEIGLRMALGAERTDVLSMVVRQGMVPVVIGIVLGIGGALALSAILSGFVYGMDTIDPGIFGILGIAMAAVGLFATYLPAREASHIAPMEALRYE